MTGKGKYQIISIAIGRHDTSHFAEFLMSPLIPETLLRIKGWARDQSVAFFNPFMQRFCNKLINDGDFMCTARRGR